MLNRRNISTPVYLVRETALRRNLDLIADVQRRAGVKIIMAFKANALWRTFHIMREYGIACTASSLNELRLGHEFLTHDVHSYTPAYTPETIDTFIAGSTHITFNSLGQWQRFGDKVKAWNSIRPDSHISAGLRVNPRCSVVETDIYNPALPGSRFGEPAEALAGGLPDGIEGLHFHALCEGSADDLRLVLEAFESQFGHLLDKVKWVNMGGGHLMTREGYDTDALVATLLSFRERHPGVEVILEPGSAFTWRTGDLLTSVVDVMENDGVRTAIIDASFACHMPDTLEMPYKPAITEAVEPDGTLPSYRLGGNSCLSGDFTGDWTFAAPLQAGDRLTHEDMNHYTTVKTTMFNGLQHPDIALEHADGSIEMLRQFTYDDYRSRMS